MSDRIQSISGTERHVCRNGSADDENHGQVTIDFSTDSGVRSEEAMYDFDHSDGTPQDRLVRLRGEKSFDLTPAQVVQIRALTRSSTPASSLLCSALRPRPEVAPAPTAITPLVTTASSSTSPAPTSATLLALSLAGQVLAAPLVGLNRPLERTPGLRGSLPDVGTLVLGLAGQAAGSSAHILYAPRVSSTAFGISSGIQGALATAGIVYGVVRDDPTTVLTIGVPALQALVVGGVRRAHPMAGNITQLVLSSAVLGLGIYGFVTQPSSGTPGERGSIYRDPSTVTSHYEGTTTPTSWNRAGLNGMILGGIGLGAGVLGFILDPASPSSPSSARHISMSPYATADGVGAVVHGTF
ncbi:MAG: hypothetical protein IPJ69_11175 [Deltaproteobacteria bacterium]|nr:MAG: hypothetical protein IPJ69_11175 [Deltaproteobacteria bacterium]